MWTIRGMCIPDLTSDVSYEDIKDSGFERYLGDDYSKTKWFWTKDTLFGTEDNALFIGRYVRSLGLCP